MMLKKIIFISLLSAGLVACSNNDDVKPSNQKQDPTPVAQQKTEEKPKPKPRDIEKITPVGGLGDHLDVFEIEYGPNRGSESAGRFENDYIHPMFQDGNAYSLILQFDKSPRPFRSKVEVLNEIEKMIPSDSKLIKEYQDKQNRREIFHYKSKSLSDRIDKEMFGDAEPGEFVVVMKKSDKGLGYSYVAMGVGNNP